MQTGLQLAATKSSAWWLYRATVVLVPHTV